MKLGRKIESQVKKTLKQIGLKKNEPILVALSGGKDSTVTAYLLKKFGYNLEGFHIDLKIGAYSEKCLKSIQKLCSDLKIKLHVYDITFNGIAGESFEFYNMKEAEEYLGQNWEEITENLMWDIETDIEEEE